MKAFAIPYFLIGNLIILSLWFDDKNAGERYQNGLMCLMVSGIFLIYSELKGRKP